LQKLDGLFGPWFRLFAGARGGLLGWFRHDSSPLLLSKVTIEQVCYRNVNHPEMRSRREAIEPILPSGKFLVVQLPIFAYDSHG